MFPLFAKASALDASGISWMAMDANLREQMLVKGQVDAITGFLTSEVPSLEALGVKPSELTVMRYDAHGLDCYGNAVFGTREFVARNPRTTAAMVKAVNNAMLEMVRSPTAALNAIKARDPLVKMDVEAGRMAMYIRDILLTAHVKANGFSSVDPARLQKSIDAVVETYGLGSMTTTGQVYVDRFLPPKAGRMPLPQGVAAPAAP